LYFAVYQAFLAAAAQMDISIRVAYILENATGILQAVTQLKSGTLLVFVFVFLVFVCVFSS
jgi:type III secretory pathway component EscS